MTKDEEFMKLALHQASVASMIDEVPIGCVIVRNGEVIAKAYNKRINLIDPTAHAEIMALRQAARVVGNWQLVDCELYVTIEPCMMCAGAIIQSRIKRVVFGALEPKGGAFGSSINALDAKNINHRPEIVSGVLEEECAEIIRTYFKNKRKVK